MPWIGLRCVIVVCPDHTHLLFREIPLTFYTPVPEPSLILESLHDMVKVMRYTCIIGMIIQDLVVVNACDISHVA